MRGLQVPEEEEEMRNYCIAVTGTLWGDEIISEIDSGDGGTAL